MINDLHEVPESFSNQVPLQAKNSIIVDISSLKVIWIIVEVIFSISSVF